MATAAIYARVSSARQKEEQTIASQTAALQAHAAATGKVLLALSDPAEDVKTGPLGRLTDRTIDSWAKLSEALAEVRNNGFATNVGELDRG